jgi:hypothetical protein
MRKLRLAHCSVAALFAVTVLLCVPPGRAQENGFIPPGMDALAAHATFHTEFTFDKSMLDAASQNFPDPERRIVAQLRSITVDSFRFSGQGMYDDGALEAARAAYRGQGWQHMVIHPHAAVDAQGIPEPDSGERTRTDLWVRMKHSNVESVVLLVANGRNVNLVAFDGTISPLDLLHLRGHFGIPRFDGEQWENGKE